jgi:uncharacterized protein YjiS (DUF1127 family)
MAFTTLSTPVACHETSHKWMWLARLRRAWLAPRVPHVAGLDDRAMRDIGLSRSESGPLRHRHLSQHTHHPYG